MRRAPGCVAGGQAVGGGHQQRAGPGQHEQEPRDPPRPRPGHLPEARDADRSARHSKPRGQSSGD